MLTPLLIIAALALVQIAQSGNLLLPQEQWWVPFSGAMLLLAATEYAARQLARHPRGRGLHRIDLSVQLLALMLFSYWVLSSDWVRSQTHSTLCLLPLLLLQFLLWFSLGRCVSHDGWRQRLSFAALRFRFELLPILVLVIGLDFFQLLAGLWNSEQSTAIPEEVLQLLMALVLISILPLLLVRLWGCRRIHDPQLQQLIQDACRRSGVHITRAYTWPRRPFPFYNAMAMGLLPRTRIVIISEDLVAALSPEECQAVIGHELGHLRYRHLLIYLLLLFAISMWASLLVWLSHDVWAPAVSVTAVESIQVILQVALILLGIRVIFGLVSRACERQADLHGASITSFEAMQTALLRVAQLIGQDLDTPSWRHHSIAERVAFLQSQSDNPHILQQQTAHIMRLSTLIIILLLTVLTFSIWQNSQRMNLEQARKSDPALDAALEQASNSSSDERLYEWLAAHSELERQQYHKAAMYRALGENQTELSELEYSQRIYKNRFWFTPFLRISTGNSDYDLSIDNDIAYAMVLGPKTDEERAAARSVLDQIEPRLRESVTKRSNAQIEDTLACIYYVQGNYEAALEYFKKAKQHLPDARNISDEKRTVFASLLDKRISAAETALAASQDQSDNATAIPELPTE